ncbi:MAG: GreA/GreB family elongation factor [Clostridia bacterium]|nr:GreA/GreB family elongation factor [Clostridia bacterium]
MIVIKEYRCLNGEIVKVEIINNNHIIVHYKGEKYLRNKSIIGKTLFPIQKRDVITIDSIVEIKNLLNDEIIKVKICDVHTVKTYRRMGGSYYGNSVKISYIGNNSGFKDGVFNVSSVSPLGKSLLNRSNGDEILVSLPDDTFEKYKIISVC